MAGELRDHRSSLVCGLDVHKDSVYATAMSFGGEVVDKRKLSNNEVVRSNRERPPCIVAAPKD
jgi:predicted RNase H-like nuclease (RuvC/YqgF family)